ncbi:S8 family serine peptidase [Desulfovibrio sp. OttesenSCG-928-M14]|nr:S8 family serine peptidase [Desulfovibrio sp. OttesenSCG-928-M14]
MLANRLAFRLVAGLCALCLLVITTHSVCVASADSWKTQEYINSTGLNAMNAADAYDLGFTGKGAVVGVLDGPFAPPIGEFLNKYPYGYLADEPEYNDDGWTIDEDGDPDSHHGAHVSGIIAAARDGAGMHGVAFDAQLLPLSNEYKIPQRYIDDIENGRKYLSISHFMALRGLLDYPDVKIVNNSWGVNIFLDTKYEDPPFNFGANFWRDLANSESYQEFVKSATDLAAQGKLLIFAAGNEGHLSPNSIAGLPTVMANAGEDASAFENNWINVASFDPAYKPNDGRFISVFSNLGQSASQYTLLAPGTNIYSAVASDKYAHSSGTSMAAPYVAGVAALVQQAFPYMDGKQMADVLFSTATPMNNASTMPRYFISNKAITRVDKVIDGSNTEFIPHEADETGQLISAAPIIYTYDNTFSVNDLTPEERAYFMQKLDRDEDELEEILNKPVQILDYDKYSALFGHGIVNAGKAVRGPGYFDANRLDPVSDLAVNEFGDGNSYAMYGVNTLGYDSVWGNDIEQRTADPGNLLAGLDVGLRKQGDGYLYLAGKNTYQGPTVIEGGAISLGTPNPLLPSGEVVGDVFVRDAGTLTGVGKVGGNVNSSGLLLPGHESDPGGTLNVTGDVTSAGAVQITLGQEGAANKLSGNNLDLSQSRLIFKSGNGEPIEPFENYSNLLSASGVLSLPTLPTAIDLSAFISFGFSITPNSLSLGALTKPLDSLENVPQQTQVVATALQHMFDKLEGSPLQDQIDFLYGLDRKGFLDTAASMRGDVQAATLTALPLSGMLNRMVAANPIKRNYSSPDELSDLNSFVTAAGAAGPDIKFWFRPFLSYSKIDGRSSIGQSSTENRAKGFAIGAQRENNDFHAGLLFAIGIGDLSHGDGDADILDTRVGAYAGYTPGGLSLSALLSGGWQEYDTARSINLFAGKNQLNSDFNGYSFGFGLSASYNLLHNMETPFALKPYAAFDAEHIYQESRSESGNDVFGLDIDSKDYWRVSVSPGLRTEFTPLDWLTFSASGGYKRILDGDNPKLDVAFKGNSGYRFPAISPYESKDIFTYEIGIEAEAAHNLKLALHFYGEESNRSSSYSGFANMVITW